MRENKGQNQLFFKGDEKGFSVELKGTKYRVTYLRMCSTWAFQSRVGVIHRPRSLKKFTYWTDLLFILMGGRLLTLRRFDVMYACLIEA